MAQAKSGIVERRKYERLPVPITLSYVSQNNNVLQHTTARNISAEGIGFDTNDKVTTESDVIDLIINIPGAPNPVHAKGKVAWKKKLTLEDTAPYEFGVEFVKIEEDNKNTFLRFLCDLLYKISKEPHNDKKEK